MKHSCIVLLAFVFTSVIYAQNYLPDYTAMKSHADKVMLDFSKKKFEEAFKQLEEYWFLTSYEVFSEEASVVDDIHALMEDFGDIIGVEYIEENKVKDFLYRLTYLVRFEKYIIRVYIIYYKNNEGWMVNQFKWDEDIDDIFK